MSSVTKKILLTVLLFGFAKAGAAEIPFAHRINFTSFESQRTSFDAKYDIIEIVGLAKYGNECKVKDYKFKTLSQSENNLSYTVLGTNSVSYTCPKIYMPVERNYTIDRLKISKESNIAIYVNGEKAYED